MPFFQTEPAATNNAKLPAPLPGAEGNLPFRISDKRSFVDFAASAENKITLEFYTEEGFKNIPKTIFKYDQNGKLEETLVRKSPTSSEWSVYKGEKQELSKEEWQGTYRITNNDQKLELLVSPMKDNPSHLEITSDLNGNKKYQKVNPDGSLLIGNEKLQLTEVQRSDGTKIFINPSKEKITSENINYPRNEKITVIWNYDQNKKSWISNQGIQQKESPLSPSGFISYLDQNGDLHSIALDGTKGIKTKNNSFIQQKENLIIMQSGDKLRVIEFTDEKTISSIKLYAEDKLQTKINISSYETFKINPDLGIECKKADGSKLLLNNDLSVTEVDPQNKIIKTINVSGAQKIFTYDRTGTLKAINETSESGKTINWFSLKGYSNHSNTFVKSASDNFLSPQILGRLSFDEFGRIKKISNFAEVHYKENSKQIQKLVTTEADGSKKIYERQGDSSNWVVNPGKKEFSGNIFITSRAELAFDGGKIQEVKLIDPFGKYSTKEFKNIASWEAIVINKINLKGDLEYVEYGEKQSRLASSQGGISGHYPYEPLPAIRKFLFNAIDENYSPARSHRLKCCLAYFEHRLKLIADYQTQLGKKSALNDFGIKIEETYLRLADLIKATSSNQYGKEDRINIAEQIIAQIAEPRAINQGANPTCNISTVEIFTAAMEPQNYVKVINDLILFNTFQDMSLGEKQSKRYNINPLIFTPENNIPRQYRPSDSLTSFDLNHMVSQLSIRSPASMLFQRGTISATRNVNGNVGYVFVAGNTGFTFPEIIQASNLINGYKMPYVVPAWSSYQLEIDPKVPMPNNKGGTTNGSDIELFRRAEEKVAKNGMPFGYTTFRNRHVQVVFPQLISNADGSVRYHTTFGDNTWGINGDQAKSWVGLFDGVLKGQLPIPIEKIFTEDK